MTAKRMRILAVLSTALLLCSSCGSAAKSMATEDMLYMEKSAAPEAYMDDYSYDTASWDGESGYTSMAKAAPMQTSANRSEQSAAENDLENRKLIKQLTKRMGQILYEIEDPWATQGILAKVAVK